jgi:Fur family iron response transcriptional regulator
MGIQDKTPCSLMRACNGLKNRHSGQSQKLDRVQFLDYHQIVILLFLELHAVMHYRRDNMADLLRAHDINPTHQRIEIAYALFSRQAHLSADQVMTIVNDRHAETSKATVYNTLKLFLEKGMIREVIVDPSKVFYDPNISPHHHLYEVDSGELTDIDAHQVRIEGLPQLPETMETEGIDLIIRVRRKKA